MRIKFIAAFLAVVAGLWGCSSVSMPSIPWSRSALPVDATAEALFQEGNRYFENKSYTRAIDALQRIKTDHPFSPLLTETELKIADAYYLNKQYPEAINAFKEFQTLHPTNENIPFVIYRLGQAHFDQFTSIDRDQKNTEIAKGYFATVVTNHPKSPYAAEAKEKLARCIEYLAEHDFDVAYFYYQQEKFPAARDRLEEIVRKYQGTATAVKSLFYLGESYRKEKNGIKAALAYEALLQHYPESRFALQARTQLAQLEKEKHDPLAMLLMRDRRPASPGTENAQEIKTAKLKELNLIAKTDVVHEEPGDEKGFFSRMASKLNPFSSSSNNSDKKKEEKTPESGLDLLVKQKQAEKEKSSGMFASLWPFGGTNAKNSSKKENASEGTLLVNQIDASLKQKGIDAAAQQVALNPPPADLPKEDEPVPQTMDTAKLLEKIDLKLEKDGKNAGHLPPAPAAAEVFGDPSAVQAIAAKINAKSEPSASPMTSGLLSSIDQKLKSKGVEPSQFELPPTAVESKQTVSKSRQVEKVELEPKLAVEKGPLFLAPSEVPVQERSAHQAQESANDGKSEESIDQEQGSAGREIPKAVVKGPSLSPPAPPAAKANEQKKPASVPGQEEETKGILEHLKDDIEGVSKVLNPFRW